MDYIDKSKIRLKNKILESPNIFLDNDGFLFDNTEKMNDAAIFTLKEIFKINPLDFPRKKAIDNLRQFYKDNPEVFNRVPWVASESMNLIKKEIMDNGEKSNISEFDIFRMSSRAYGGAFLYNHPITAKEALTNLKNFFKKNPKYYKHNSKKADEAIELIEKNIEKYKKGETSISGESYIVDAITSRMVFEVYLSIFFCKFDMEIKPIKGAEELIKYLNIISRNKNKRFGIISNRSEDSLIELLNRFNFIRNDMIPKEYITGADPLMGGKPKLHTFRKFIPKKEKVVYFGDLPTDVEVCEVLNKTDGESTAFCVVIPSKFEFYLNEERNGEENFSKEQKDFCICLPYESIISTVRDLL